MSDTEQGVKGWVRWGDGVRPPSGHVTCIWIYSDAPDFNRERLSLPPNFKLMREDEEIHIQWMDEDDNVVDSEIHSLTIEHIDEIANKYNILSGKWLIFRPPPLIDEVWEVIASAVGRGELGVSAKVASNLNRIVSNKSTHEICVYTRNYHDKPDVMRVFNALRDLGISETIHYKPDIYTYLHIYPETTSIEESRYSR